MAINPKDFMSTQTGGEGSTIQAEIETQTPDQFQANIKPQQQAEQQIVEQENPIVSQEQIVPEQEVQSYDMPLESTEPTITEEDKIYSDLGLEKPEIEIPEEVVIPKVEEPVVENPQNIQTINATVYTEDGLPMFNPSEDYTATINTQATDFLNEELLMNDGEDEVLTSTSIDNTEDGLPLYNPLAEQDAGKAQVKSEYEKIGVKIDTSGKVRLKEPPANIYPTYKLPNSDTLYQRRGDKWYKDMGKGNFVPLTKGDVKKRSEYLNNNAIAISNIGTGTKNVQKVASGVQERFGNLRTTNIDNILTSGGDPTVTDGMSFRTLTRSNIGSSDERYNQDGTINFNYDSKTANLPRETANIVGYKGKPDGQYMFPGSSSTFKKENGNWSVKAKGTKEFMPLTKGDVEDRIHNLEMSAKPLPKVKDAAAVMAVKKNVLGVPVLNMGVSDEIVSGEFFKAESYEQSFDDATNFASKDISMLLKDNMSEEQKNGLRQYQDQLKQIVGDGSYSTEKALKASEILKQAEQFFTTSKNINKSINEAAQSGVSMSRLSYEQKKMTAEDMFLTGKDSSEFASEAFELFQASSEMADFFIENTDNGKIRFDSKSGQYVISNQISERERQYLDARLGQYVQEYEKLQNERFANVNNKISAYKRSLYTSNSNVKKIEVSLQGMINSGVKVNDPKYVNLYTQMMKEKKKAEYLEGAIEKAEVTKAATFLTEPKKVAKSAAGNMSEDAKNIFNAIPKDITPKQRFDLFYESLYKETKQLMRDNGIGEGGTLSGMNTAFKDLLDWDGFYALTDAEKKAAQNVATLRELAPIYYNNDTGITQESAGFFESFMNSFSQTLFPTISKAAGFENQTGIAQKYVETFAEQGYTEDDFVDQEIIEKLNNRTDVGFYTAEGMGGMLGTTAAIIAPIIVTAGVPATSLRALKGLETVLRADVAAAKTAGIIKNAERIYDTVLSSNKVGRFLKPAIESGVKFETTGNIVGSTEDELYFLSGFAGGVASEALSGLISKMPKDKVYAYLNSIFGKQTNRAVNVMKSIGEANAKGVAETGEEFAQEVTNIYRDTDNFQELMSELSNRFGTFDDVQEFVVSSFVMGAAFGLVDRKQSDELKSKLPEDKKQQVQGAISEISAALNSADVAVEEYANNKKSQDDINTKIEEYDRQEQAGVSGQVGEGEKPVEEQPVTQSGEETPSPSGMVQGEQGQTTEPKEERVTVTNADEAKALWDQGYRPSIEGAEVQGGKDAAIDNIFNTRQEVDMVRMVTPEAQAEVEADNLKPSGFEPTDNLFNNDKLAENTAYGWRSMGEDEFNSLVSGEKTYEGGAPSSGNWIAGTPESASKFGGPGKILVEFGGINIKGGENMSEGSNASKENVTKVWKFNSETNQFEEAPELLDAIQQSANVEKTKVPRSVEIGQEISNIQSEVDDIYDNQIPSLKKQLSDTEKTADQEYAVNQILQDGLEKATSQFNESGLDINDFLSDEQKSIIEQIKSSEQKANDLEDRIGELDEEQDRVISEEKKPILGYQKLAEKIRSGKIDTKGSAMISIVPPQVLNAALEGAAITVETVGKIVEKIKESDWFKSLKDPDLQRIVERDLTSSLNNIASNKGVTDKDILDEAYLAEFNDEYNSLLYEATNRPTAENINNLKAFVSDPKSFIEDFIATNRIGTAYSLNIEASEKRMALADLVAEKLKKAEGTISSDRRQTANNIMASQSNWGGDNSAPYNMEDALNTVNNKDELLKKGDIDEQDVQRAEEYLADPIAYHMELAEAYSNENASYYDPKRADQEIKRANYIKSVYEKYGVDTGLTPEQSQNIEDQASQIPPQPKAKQTRKKLTDEEKQARADQRKAEREKIKAAREEKKKADKEFGKKVAEVTGTAKAEKTVQMTELQALATQIKAQNRGGKIAIKDLQAIKEELLNFAKANLPKDQYNKKEVDSLMASIARTKTAKGLEAAIGKVESLINRKAEAKRKRTVKEIAKKITDKRTLFSKRGNKWVGKVSIEAQKEFLDFINSDSVANLENRTQEELDAINEIIDSIVANGRADYSVMKRAEQKAKRERAAQLISGLARGKEVTLNGIDKVQEWLDKGNVVIINGQLFRKSDLKELQNQKKILESRKKRRVNELAALNQKAATDPELDSIDTAILSINDQIAEAKDQISELDKAIQSASIDENISFTGYKQGNLGMLREAETSERSKWYKPKNWVRAVNPTNAINDVYSLLKSAYSKSSSVTKFIKEKIEKPIKKAYFERQKAYNEKLNNYYNDISEIFGTKNKAISYLSGIPTENPITVEYTAKNFPLTNGHMVDWYNLIRSNENGMERMDKSNIDPNKVIGYVESDPKLKAYADYILSEYNTTLRSEYESTYKEYTNTSFGDGTYYPSYAEGFENNFMSEDEVMGVEGMYNAMNATSRNLKQRVSYSGPFNTTLSAHSKFLDYIKTMEHAKQFMPIAKSANELFSRANTPYLLEQMGISDFNDLKIHLGVILSNQPVSEYKGRFSKGLNAFRNISVISTLALKPAAIVKQWVSFTHYWTAGIADGVDPHTVITAGPESDAEWEFFKFLWSSPYAQERLSGENLDLEIKRMVQQSLTSKSAENWRKTSKLVMSNVRYGDRMALFFGPGAGSQYALAFYRKGLNEGMSIEEAKDYAYEKFVDATEGTQQTTREDYTSNIQREQLFRFMGMYRTGQMAASKKVVNGIKTLYQAHQITKAEGKQARKEVITEREKAQAISDIVYYTAFSSMAFSAVASGALFYMNSSDTSDDEETRMWYDAAMDQIQSDLQGYGLQGYVLDLIVNEARGKGWMNNIAPERFINSLAAQPAKLLEASMREYESITDEQRLEYIQRKDLDRMLEGVDQEQQYIDLVNEYNGSWTWDKMNEQEKDAFIKAIGVGNINTLVKNFGEAMDSPSGQSLIKAVMNYDEDYFEKAKESGRRDLIFEYFFNEPYLIDESEGEIKGEVPFPEPMKNVNLEEEMEEKLD